MAVKRTQNWLGQQRVDKPHLALIEAGVRGDFDVLAGSMLAGQRPLVLAGFTIISTGATAATDLQLKVAGGMLVNFNASESGSIFQVPAGQANETLNTTNAKVAGGFSPNQTNFIGIDLQRSADPTTVAQIVVLDADTLQEDAVDVPLARTLDYQIVVSTTPFELTPALVPIAKVVTGPANNIVSVTDTRYGLFRLGTGGTTPDLLHAFPWAQGRKETTAPDAFSGGDKALGNFKDWLDAVMTRCWETGGGEFWYSPTGDRNVKMVRQGTQFSNGEYFEWNGTNIHWRGLTFLFDNSTAVKNEIADQLSDVTGLTDLVDGECIFVDVDRSTNRTVAGPNAIVAQKTVLTSLGQGTPPGSRYVMAWRMGSLIYTRDQPFPINSALKVATVSSVGAVELTATDPAAINTPRVATVDVTFKSALAAGLTRGNSSGPGVDFFGGSGDLNIGSGDHDQNILLTTSRTQDSTKVFGSEVWVTSANATLEVTNAASMVTHIENLTFKSKGFNSTAGRFETGVTIEANGAIGFRDNFSVPTAPAPTLTDPIIAKLFFRTNGQTPGLVPPICRDQLCVMFRDGSVDPVSEGPAY